MTFPLSVSSPESEAEYTAETVGMLAADGQAALSDRLGELRRPGLRAGSPPGPQNPTRVAPPRSYRALAQ